MKPLTIPVVGKTFDKASGEKVTDVTVKITRKSDGKVWDLKSDEVGAINLELNRDEVYDVDYHVHGYLEHESEFSTKDLKCKDEFVLEMPMDQIKKGDKFVINNIFYDYGKATLRTESETELDKLKVFLLENLNVKVELSAHTDSRGSDVITVVYLSDVHRLV